MPLGKKPVTVIWNSASGWKDSAEQAKRVQTILSHAGAEVSVHRLTKGEDITETSRRFIKEGAEVLVAAGGDGTVNAVAAALVNSHAALAVIPAGTLNHFARDLTVPLDLDGAAECASSGHEIETDVGCVNDRIFINNSVLGMYPIYRAAREAYERRGLTGNRFLTFLAVARALARVLWNLPHLTLQLTIESGNTIRVQTPFVLLANNEHEVENWNIGHRKAINQGHLWVYVMKRCSRWAMLRYLASFLMKRFSRKDAFDVYRVRELTVDSKGDHLRVGVDGEIIKMQTPLVYRSIPLSLRVIAPATYLPEPDAT